jgi:hypothetical protein
MFCQESVNQLDRVLGTDAVVLLRIVAERTGPPSVTVECRTLHDEP